MQFIQMPCQTISEVRMLGPMKAVTFHWGSAVTAIAITQPVTAQVKLISCIPVFTMMLLSLYHPSGHNRDDTFSPAAGPDRATCSILLHFLLQVTLTLLPCLPSRKLLQKI
ncbi:hypothetical protein QTP70_031250 [Hemibagrus guttatus]|uniref:Uncharacterized protein n=1 Tax=Hemibagrus guttatus TaxID=175788 RepID=A0AAE0UNW1_9TELE|nr:hypothetical protein QTP70_031250 [Hemibagrus guttatus]